LQEYIDQHSLQKVVEDVLNGCVKTKPDEPLTFMVRKRAECSA
jgi:enolase